MQQQQRQKLILAAAVAALLVLALLMAAGGLPTRSVGTRTALRGPLNTVWGESTKDELKLVIVSFVCSFVDCLFGGLCTRKQARSFG